MRASIVVGLGYGDEGKGITTDYLCSTLVKPIVVRFSGGQQAGHTVRIGDRVHTHSNFGSGTLQGYESYFSEHCTIYPVTMKREYDVLRDKDVEAKVIVHPLAKLTTPFDVWANRSCDKNKADGTCGLGVGKTMKRHTESPHQLYAMDLHNPTILSYKLEEIAKWYGYDLRSNELTDELELFIKAIEEMPMMIASYDFLKQYENIIFEGSQGVLLDMNHGAYPNVTFSNTTSKNALEICDRLNISERHIYGVTRAYSTRHGSGPFKEGAIKLVNNEDENNKYNKFQLGFKVSPMNYDMLNHAIAIERIYSEKYVFNLVVTCNDQVKGSNQFDMAKVAIMPHILLKSYSSDSKDMQEYI